MRLTCHEFITKTHPALNEEVLPTTQHIFSQPGFALSAVSKQSSDRGQLPVGRPMYVAAATPSSLARHITMWTSAWRRVSISKFEAALRQAAIGQLWGSDRGSNIRVCVCVCARARASRNNVKKRTNILDKVANSVTTEHDTKQLHFSEVIEMARGKSLESQLK